MSQDGTERRLAGSKFQDLYFSQPERYNAGTCHSAEDAMLDRRWIVENPALATEGLHKRMLLNGQDMVESIIRLDADYRRAVTARQKLQEERTIRSREFGDAKKLDEPVAALSARLSEIKRLLDGQESGIANIEHQLTTGMLSIPNMPLPEVQYGGEANNTVLKEFGEPVVQEFQKAHWDLGPALGMNFDAGVKLAGSRFTLLRGQMASLERAVVNFLLDRHVAGGFEEVVPPDVVKPEILQGTGQLPKFAGDLFAVVDGSTVQNGHIAEGTEPRFYMVPTAEVTLTSMAAGEILPEDQLPLRLTAATNCFRSEAGAAGRDSRGIIRQHQFRKVELVSLCTPDQAWDEHDHMVESVASLLTALGLPFRVLRLAAGDMGFSAEMTYDFEVWMPGQNAYREISSVSRCGDFQARRMQARYRPVAGGKPQLLHTLNGSGVAVGRLLAAIVENFQDAEGGVVVPEALHRYLDPANHYLRPVR